MVFGTEIETADPVDRPPHGLVWVRCGPGHRWHLATDLAQPSFCGTGVSGGWPEHDANWLPLIFREVGLVCSACRAEGVYRDMLAERGRDG